MTRTKLRDHVRIETLNECISDVEAMSKDPTARLGTAEQAFKAVASRLLWKTLETMAKEKTCE